MAIIGKVGVNKVLSQPAGGNAAKPSTPGKFSAALEKSKGAKGASQTTLPPEVKDVPPAAQQQLKAELRTQLKTAKTPNDLYGSQMQNARTNIDQVSSRIQSAPKTPETQGLVDRLNSIETQYNNSEQLVSKLDGLSSPRDLLKVQMEMYKMTQNIELLSRASESLVGGAKQIMQTQI